MKVLKKADQKNIVLDKYMYSDIQIQQMLKAEEIFYIKYGTSGVATTDWDLTSTEICENDFRIYTVNLKEIKVECYQGCYHTVAIGNNGKKYFVVL